MYQAKLKLLVLTGAFWGAYSTLATAQAGGDQEDQSVKITYRNESLKPAIPPSAFRLDGKPVKDEEIEFRSVGEMTEKDRELAANAESSIGERASYAGLEFNSGAWSYQQIVCRALPAHIFLRFLRNNGTGDVSMFTASIPRGDEGRVRIIPIQMRSYSLWSPAPINATTLAAFNRIRSEENSDKTAESDWVGTGLCYAALAGGDPHLGNHTDHPEKEKFPVATTATMDIPSAGGSVVSFPDMGGRPRPVQWEMTFDRTGKLLKAAKTPAPLLTGYWYVHPVPVDVTGTKVPTDTVKAIHYIPKGPASAEKRVPPNQAAQTAVPVPPAN